MLNRVRAIRLSFLGGLGLSYGLFLLVVAFFYFWRLGSFTPGLSANEVITLQASQNWQSISDNPVYAPYKLLQYGLAQVGVYGHLWPRLISAVLATLLIICCWTIAKEWFGRLIGTFGALLLASTPWLIISGRLATASVLLLTPAALLIGYLWLLRSKQYNNLFWLGFCLILGLAVYIPGLLWIIAVGALAARKRLRVVLKKLNRWVLYFGLLLLVVLMSPLILATVRNWAVIKPLLLIPDHWPGVVSSLKDIGWSALSLVWQTPQNVDFTIGRWPMLNVLQVVLALVGAIVMWSRARTILYGSVAVVLLSIIGAGINQNTILLLLALPSLVILQTAGLRYLYLEWRTIFPRNPVAQTFAFLLLALLVAGQVFFGGRFALSAWPNTIATKTSYVLE